MQVKCTACQCIGTVEHLTTKHFIVHFVTVADLEAERKGHARQAVLKNFQGGGHKQSIPKWGQGGKTDS